MKRKKEFSKLIMICALTMGVYVIAFTSVMVWRTSDLSPLYELIRGVTKMLEVWVVSYSTKALLENRVKLQKKYPWMNILGADQKQEQETRDHNEKLEV